MRAFYMARDTAGWQAQSQHDVADIRAGRPGVTRIAGRFQQRPGVRRRERRCGIDACSQRALQRFRRRRLRRHPRSRRRVRPCRLRAAGIPDDPQCSRAAATARCWQRPPRPATLGQSQQPSRRRGSRGPHRQRRARGRCDAPLLRHRPRVARFRARPQPRAVAARATASSASSSEPTSRGPSPGASSRPDASTAGSSRGTSEIMSAWIERAARTVRAAARP